METLIQNYVDIRLKQARAQQTNDAWAIVAGSLSALLQYALDDKKEVVIKRMKEVIDEK